MNEPQPTLAEYFLLVALLSVVLALLFFAVAGRAS